MSTKHSKMKSHALPPNNNNTYQRSTLSFAQINKYHSSPTFALGLESFTSQHRSASVNPPLTCYNG